LKGVKGCKYMIVLKPFERSDFNTLISWIDSPESMIQWCGRTFSYPLDQSQLEKYLKGAEENPPPRKIFKAVDSENGEHAGNITLECIDRENKSAAITCVIIGNINYRGKGICEIMMRSVIETAFNELGLTKLTLNVFDYNNPAIKCYMKAGFKIVDKIVVKYDEKEMLNVKMEIVSDP
jgi:RimJ/RimL family protein N-acetyltransferase